MFIIEASRRNCKRKIKMPYGMSSSRKPIQGKVVADLAGNAVA
jgi:hypothetical protein